MTYERLEYKDIIIGYAFTDRVHTHNYDHEKAHELLESMLYKEFGIRLCDLKYEKHSQGKPYFKGSEITFNLSHCKGMVACALGRNVEMGIDCENIRDYKENVAKRVCSEDELKMINQSDDKNQAFFACWTCKESIIKLTGTGIACDLSKVNASDKRYNIKQWILENCNEKYYISVALATDVV